VKHTIHGNNNSIQFATFILNGPYKGINYFRDNFGKWGRILIKFFQAGVDMMPRHIVQYDRLKNESMCLSAKVITKINGTFL